MYGYTWYFFLLHYTFNLINNTSDKYLVKNYVWFDILVSVQQVHAGYISYIRSLHIFYLLAITYRYTSMDRLAQVRDCCIMCLETAEQGHSKCWHHCLRHRSHCLRLYKIRQTFQEKIRQHYVFSTLSVQHGKQGDPLD